MRTILFCGTLILQTFLCHSQSITFDEVSKQESLKRGKEYQISWKGGSSNEIVTVQLLKKDVVVKEWPSILNTGKCLVYLPSNLKPGGYSFAIINSSTQALIQSDQTKIKRRIPLFVKLSAPITLAVIVLLMNQENDMPPIEAPQ